MYLSVPFLKQFREYRTFMNIEYCILINILDLHII